MLGIYFSPFYSSLFQSCICKYATNGVSTYFCNGFEFTCKQHIVLNHVFFRYESSGRKIRGFQRRSWSAAIQHGESIVRAGCDWLRLVLASCCTCRVSGMVWLVTSLQIWNSNNADVLLNSGLNLFDIMANLCSKLYYEVLLKSWNYIVYLLRWTSALDFNKRGCVRRI